MDEIIELAEADNYSQDYIAYKGNYIKKFDKNVAEQYRDDLRAIEIEKREEKKNTTKEQEKVLILKDNIEKLDYIEDMEKITEEEVELPSSLRYSDGIELKEHQKEGLLRMQSLYKKSNVSLISTAAKKASMSIWMIFFDKSFNKGKINMPSPPFYRLFSFIIPFFLKKRKKDFIFSKI